MKTTIEQADYGRLAQRIATNVAANARTGGGGSALVGRAGLAASLGMQFGGLRDVYAAAGYDKVISPAQYVGRYERQDIAARIVTAPADETWRLSPEVRDGLTLPDSRDDTEFVTAWRQIAAGGQADESGETMRGLLHYLQRVDRLAGIGRYGVLLLGVRDGRALDEPLERGAAQGPGDLLYVTALAEQHAQISTLTQATSSRRYGLPEYYQLTLWQSPGAATTQRVHWSRVIHVADGLQSDEIYGTPRLQAVWNRLMDIEKIMAGSGEAAWKLLDSGRIISTKDGYELPEDPDTRAAQKAEIDEFMHNLRRWLLMEGIEVSELGGQVTDPTGLVTINVALIAAATGIPQRILLGSERGELASTQDERAWARQIETRQQNYAEPMVLRPVINRLVWAGVLPPPASGAYQVAWPALVETDRQQEAATAEAVARALAAVGAKVDARAFVEVFVPELPPDAVEEPALAAPPAMVATPADEDGEEEEDIVEEVDPNLPVAQMVAVFKKAWADFVNQPWPDAPGQGEEGGQAPSGAPFPGIIGQRLVLELEPDDDEEEERKRRALERRAAQEIAAGLQEQLEAVAGAVLGQEQEGLQEYLHGEFMGQQLEASSGTAREALRQALWESADLGVRLAVRQLHAAGVGFNWQLAAAEAAEWADNYGYELVGGINETSRAYVARALEEWIEAGRPLGALRTLLAEIFGEKRARLIADTEVTRAYAQGSLRSYRASGVVESKEWLTSVDEMVCPRCGGLAGRVVGLDEEFEAGVYAPPDAHPGCRCRVRGVLKPL